MSVRRRSSKKDDPRARILDAALSTFAALGSDAASIADVAARAHMSKQALMHHFRTKELLRAGVYQELARRIRVVFLDIAADLVRGGQDYGRPIELLAQRLADAPTITRFMLFELLGRPSETERWLRAEAAPWVDLVTKVIDQDRLPRGAATRQRSAERRVAHDELDADAHVTVLTALMLAVSALVPRGDPQWWRRVNRALLRVLRASSLFDGRALPSRSSPSATE
jgi:AcrR family transcriptional regulator